MCPGCLTMFLLSAVGFSSAGGLAGLFASRLRIKTVSRDVEPALQVDGG